MTMEVKAIASGRDLSRLIEVEQLIQQHFPEAVLVGGTAAALHARHRVSFAVASVLPDLAQTFPDVLRRLESLAGWKTRRIRPPVLILGHFEGIDVGIRQLRRDAPLETETIEGVIVPTLPEMLRIKGWLVVTRNALRDYLDFAALADKLGNRFGEAMEPMERLYPQPPEADTTLQQLAKQLVEPRPYDFDPDRDSLTAWRRLTSPWTDWAYVVSFLQRRAQDIFDLLVGPPTDGPSGKDTR
jgi:hypothetical protein